MLIDRQFAGVAANFVGVDDGAVGDLATTHLIEIGCRRIAHIRGPEVSTAIGRLRGLPPGAGPARSHARQWLRGGASRSGDDAGDVSGYEAMRQLLQLAPAPDGVFCYNDPVAMGAMKAILEAGKRIPDDVAVIGCGNVHYAELLRVPLSSVDQASATIGEQAAKLALSLMGSKAPVKPKTILLEPTLVVRASTQRYATATRDL